MVELMNVTCFFSFGQYLKLKLDWRVSNRKQTLNMHTYTNNNNNNNGDTIAGKIGSHAFARTHSHQRRLAASRDTEDRASNKEPMKIENEYAMHESEHIVSGEVHTEKIGCREWPSANFQDLVTLHAHTRARPLSPMLLHSSHMRDKHHQQQQNGNHSFISNSRPWMLEHVTKNIKLYSRNNCARWVSTTEREQPGRNACRNGSRARALQFARERDRARAAPRTKPKLPPSARPAAASPHNATRSRHENGQMGERKNET